MIWVAAGSFGLSLIISWEVVCCCGLFFNCFGLLWTVMSRCQFFGVSWVIVGCCGFCLDRCGSFWVAVDFF